MPEPENLAERQDLTQAITELRDQVQLLWHAIDELRESFEYAVRNRDNLSPTEHRRITSMPSDPTAPDFAERVNSITPADIKPQNSTSSQLVDEKIDPDTLIVVSFADGDVGIFMPDGSWLATEHNRDEAIKEAEMKIIGYQNGASWARAEIEQGRNHLQTSFPDIARQHGLVADPVADDPNRHIASSDEDGPLQGELFAFDTGGNA